MMICDQNMVIRVIENMADLIAEKKDFLTELDSKIGDGDHGINMNRGFVAVRSKLGGVRERSIGSILKTVGMTLVSTVGGASGPLYGTAFMYAGNEVGEKNELSFEDVVALSEAALAGIIKRGRAEVGDKTMVDTVYPVVEYLRSVKLQRTVLTNLAKGVTETARRGMHSTKALMARKGRASFLKERSIGHLDPGAVSSYFLTCAVTDEAPEL